MPPIVPSSAATSRFAEGGMPKSATVQAHRWRGATTAFLVIATSCTQLPTTSSVAIPPVSPSTARIWIPERRAKRAQPDALCEAERPNSRGRAAERGFLSGCPPRLLYGRCKQLRRSLSPSVCRFQPWRRAGGLCRGPVHAGEGRHRGGIAHPLFSQFVSPDIARPAIARTPFYGGS